MSATVPWQVLVVDDDRNMREEIAEYFAGGDVTAGDTPIEVNAVGDFVVALDELERRRYDLVVLDVRRGSTQAEDGPVEDEAGTQALRAIQARRFVPIVFYTGVPHQVRGIEAAFTQVVEKTESVTKLAEVIVETLQAMLPQINRALIRHFEEVQRAYLWEFAQQHWGRFDAYGRGDVALLLARRLAASLTTTAASQLLAAMGDTSRGGTADAALPLHYYVLPPLSTHAPQAGDIYFANAGTGDGYWVLLTPSCDLVADRLKAEHILLAKCIPLSESAEYKSWAGKKTDANRIEKLKRLLQNRQGDRHYFLPAALTLPDQVIDFQQTVVLPCTWLDDKKPVAYLDSPFAEEVLNRFARYFGRLGTPDLDADAVLARL